MSLDDPYSLDRDEAAARWMTLAARGAMGRADRHAFRRWLSLDTRNRAAMQRASIVWQTMDGMKHEPSIQAERTRARNVRQAMAVPQPRPWGVIAGAVAASLILALGIGSMAPQAAQAYEAPIGQHRRVVLADGTVVDLNSGTRIEAKYGWFRRTVRLVRGEAQFTVNRRLKPFAVTANDVEVKGDQARFLIRDFGAETSVLLVDGDVRLLREGERTASIPIAGRLMTIDPAKSTIPSRRVDPADQMAWIDGRVVFDQTTVAEAAVEFERYHAIRIRLADDVGALKISGAYRTRDLTSFLDALSRIHPVKWSEAGGGAVLIEEAPRRAS